MKKIKTLSLISILLMIAFSLSAFLKLEVNGEPLTLTSITLLIGIIVFFITREPEDKDVMSLKAVPKLLKDKITILLVIIPTLADILCFTLAKYILPEFLEHISDRTDFLAFDKFLILLVELIVAALGEEIAWRGFFQPQLSKLLPFGVSLMIMSVLFAICHMTTGSVIVILYDMLFIVINAIIYGLVYKRTHNIPISTLSHFIANLSGVLILLVI
ncbi:MAG: CPBP family intramembrane metalloprotease [Clostridium sp.]|nr:CPBP family intramembrane metalloprotease [Clostridium sp.]MCM1173219.1 CPBP family intramembrane metalloprotease [Clostridium sp.]MCM1209447.1 CPBP family intramembrane metalloprotease [Ruminococcus sp.]